MSVYFTLALFSIVFFIGFVGFVINNNINKAHEEFLIQGNDTHQHLVQVTQSNNFILDSFSSLLTSIGLTSYSTLVNYSNEVLKRVPFIYQIQAAQRVEKSDLNHFNEEQNIYQQFKVRVFTGTEFIDAKNYDAQVFYPITFFADKENAKPLHMGLDVQSLPFLEQPTKLASQLNKTIISEPFEYENDELVFVMVQPAYFSNVLNPDFFTFFVIKADVLLHKSDANAHYNIRIYLKEHPDKPLIDTQQQSSLSAFDYYLPRFSIQKEVDIEGQIIVLDIQRQLSFAAISLELLAATLFVFILFLASFYLMYRLHLNSEKEKAAHSRELYRLANFDALTNLANRLSFESALESALKLAERRENILGILYLDLDGFKAINDSLGHHVGDEALKMAANKIRASVRDVDIVGRLGGDEFAIVLTEISSVENCIEIKNRVEQSICSIDEIEGHKVSLGASVGYTLYPIHETSADKLLDLADQYMYQNKRKKKKSWLPKFDKLA